MKIGLICVPRLKISLRMEFEKGCPWCGTVNGVGGLLPAEHCICWICRLPLYPPEGHGPPKDFGRSGGSRKKGG